jgi:hypothetical protein
VITIEREIKERSCYTKNEEKKINRNIENVFQFGSLTKIILQFGCTNIFFTVWSVHLTASDFSRLKNISILSKNINVRRNCNKISRYSRDRFYFFYYIFSVLDNFPSRLIMYRHKRQRDRQRERERGRDRERERQRPRESERHRYTDREREKKIFLE